VIINGRVVLEAGQFPAFNERELLREIGRASAGLLKRMGVTVEANRINRTARARHRTRPHG
jgi:hypothetical protein